MSEYGHVERTIQDITDKLIYVCDQCGNTNIVKRAWVDYNTDEYEESLEHHDEYDAYCNDCEDFCDPITREQFLHGEDDGTYEDEEEDGYEF